VSGPQAPSDRAAVEALAPEAAAALAEGFRLYAAGDLASAHAAFARAHRRATGHPRTTSWYGLTLVLVERNSSLGVLYCDQAIRLAGPEAELLLNQARAHLALGQRERAVRAIARGLERWPGDPALRAAQASMGWRRRPVLPFLSRNNPVNRWLGSLRHRWARRLNPSAPATPATLGLVPGGQAKEALP